MSESENIDSHNNLCVTENTFEQFQARPATEEDDFIMLSDILEPPKPTLDLNACLNEIQDDICIVSESDPQRDENIESESGMRNKNSLIIPVTNPTDSNKESCINSMQNLQDIAENTPQLNPKRRGRRKQNTLSSEGVKKQLKIPCESASSVNQSTSLKKGNSDSVKPCDKTIFERLNPLSCSELDSTTKLTTRRRKRQFNSDKPRKSQAKVIDIGKTLKSHKRGRPKKVNTLIAQQQQSYGKRANYVSLENITETGNTSERHDLKEDTIDNSLRANKDLVDVHKCTVTSALDTEQCLDKKQTRKRGRPKKSKSDTEDVSQLKNNEVTHTSPITPMKQNSAVSSSKSEKEVSKKKLDDKKYDEIELELIRMLSTPTEELEKKCSKKETGNKCNPPRKRARKQQKISEGIGKHCEESQDTKAEKAASNDEADDVCLSSLKKKLIPEESLEKENTLIVNEDINNLDGTSENITDTLTKRNSKKPIMSDFEYNVDTIETESIIENASQENVAELDHTDTESPSKRPIRKRAKKVLDYDEGSDEDPFANVELSDDDEDLSGRRGGRYYSDDEYIPGKRKKGKTYLVSESSASESDRLENNEHTIVKSIARKKGKKLVETLKKKQSKKKDRTKKAVPDVTSTAADTTTQNDDDDSLQSPDITTNDNSIQKPLQDVSHEFENFIAQKIQGTNLKIKKLTSTNSNESVITPIEIPVLDPNEPKKTVTMSTQTNKTLTTTVEVQTTSPYEGFMKCKVPLTPQQSVKACEFLKGIVNNTSELGQLMIQKSEDFIQKKINTKNIIDTNKLDYCVQKSFLLFKLAKHNLIQMEEDLANEYEQFLKSTNMSQFRELPKSIIANPKQTDSDSDCEIVEEPIIEQEKEKDKSKFNLKTVFLNKELSIKIAKKSSEEPQAKKKNIEHGKHTVWINDSIMVKKIKPTQSFLAQDSRNKKPPDTFITYEMVRDFFLTYHKRQKVLVTCAPFVSPEWINVNQMGVCNYFIAQYNDISTQSRILFTPQSGPQPDISGMNSDIKENLIIQPKTLLSLCTRVLHTCMYKTRSNYKESFHAENNISLEQDHQPSTLFRLSFNVISNMLIVENKQMLASTKLQENISSLKDLCLKSVNTLIHRPIIASSSSSTLGPTDIIENISRISKYRISNANQIISNKQIKRNIKSLFSCCVEVIQKDYSIIQEFDNINVNERNITSNEVKTLKCIAFENVKLHLYSDKLLMDNEARKSNYGIKILEQASLLFPLNDTNNLCCIDTTDQLALTIKTVNTLSDDIFAKLPDVIDNDPSYSEDDDSNFSNYDEYDPVYAKSNCNDNFAEEGNWVSRVQLQELKSCFKPIDDNSNISVTKQKECGLASIKIEPLEEASENIDPSIVKTELAENDEAIFNPLETKLEGPDTEDEDTILERTSSSYNVDAFEEFARMSKMLHRAADYDFANDEVFSQSALRVRKQHEPDKDDEFDTDMSLLVPQQNADLAKDRLMKSSSDEESNTQKNIIKKKRKIRTKVTRLKNKDIITSKNKITPENEVALLTKRMQERIRQEEKSDNSSDSELENSLAKLKYDKLKRGLVEKAKTNMDKDVVNEIQCNDVDSTENFNEKPIINHENKKEVNSKKVTKKALRNKNRKYDLQHSNDLTEQDNTSFVIQPDVPVELLECEPTLPMMHDYNSEMEDDNDDETNLEPELPEEISYIDRHGWKCYPVNDSDTKLYEHTYILLEKLPETFVETYFKYQGMADKNQDDNDIDRLTNLQSLHRSVSKENKVRNKTRPDRLPNGRLKPKDTENDSRATSPICDDHYNELTPSEDEGHNIDNETAPLAQDATENFMAKNSLMNDVESDSEKPTNSEDVSTNKPITKEKDVEPTSKRYRAGPKSKKAVIENDSTLLTADKMMNKELALLHAPVTLDPQDVKVKEINKKPSKNRTSSRLRAHLEQVKVRDESSSEEEKQWVTTKEKLLKRLGKKQGNSSVDDAKRAKIVSEFIEKRGDAHDKRPVIRARKRRSRKKFLERKKQMSILNRELFGEHDASYASKKHSQAFGKGRRNIRKVIDKKSLARNTVIANMEEFERKRRLNMQHTRLREQLGCEEGVNVLVINDEVCLEYDFEQMRPVVTIHPFFTKVMKAHQYEGVKFMWDACFESLALVAAGHPGGGCILAHCMGLGKTLQVLALLHTVLTHPGVGMKRVLVCCPLSTVLNWVDEINKWIGPVTNQIKVFELSKLKKTYERAYQLEDWYKDGGIFIIGYELFRSLTTLDSILDDIKPKIIAKIRHALLSPGPDVVICDEGHLLKNDASVLAVAMSRVATRRRIVLTGTPMQNNLREYYCMVNFVKPNLLGTYAEYSNRFENPIMNGQHRDSQEEDIKLMKARTHILHKVLEGCLQRQEASVLYPYLPKKHEYTVFIPPTKCQWDLYKHYMMTYALEQQQQQKQPKQSLLKDFHVLQKIWTHPQVLHNFLMKARDERNKIKEEKLEDDLAQEDLAASEDIKPNQTEVWWLQYLEGGGMLDSLESSNKFVVVFQLLDEFITLGDKVLIFSTSLYTLDALEYFLKRINKWSLGQEYFRLDGSVPAEVRQKWCREFNAPNNVNTKLFLISTRAGCLGLNMTAANRVIILDTSWNPAHDIQSIFRVYRFGQKKDCYIYRLVAMGTMEQKIYERSVTKQAVSCRVVDEQQIDRHYNMAELTELYRFDEEGATVEAGLAAGVSDVALLRVAARARLHAVREHDSLLRGSREQHLPEHERNAAWMQFQQEHANNEMQDRLLEASQGIQRILEPKYAQSALSLQTEIEEKPQLITPQPAPKGRKSKKKAATTTSTEDSTISESKDILLDPNKEEAKVKKIMQLLIKHNFHTSQRAHEISNLVVNVRTIVDAGGAGLEHCDELTRSIATVMLHEEEETPTNLAEPPPLVDIISGDVVTSSSKSEVKIEISHEPPNEVPNEPPVETSKEITDGTPEKITDRTSYTQCEDTLPNDYDESSLLTPVVENRRKQRGRPRKYFPNEIFEPTIKRTRGRPRKNTTDTEMSSMDDEINMPLQSRAKQIKLTSTDKKSIRLKSKPRRSNTTDSYSSVSDTWKEKSSETDDEPLVPASKKTQNEESTHKPSESHVTVIDDDDTISPDDNSVIIPNVGKLPEERGIKKARRAIAVKSTAKASRPETNVTGKVKRKAALAAEQHLEKLDNDTIVTLDDDDDEWVVNGNEQNSGRNRLASKLGTPSRGSDNQINDKSKTSNLSYKNDVRFTKQGESSILLSDDEDRPNTNVPPREAPSESADTDPEETVPLHPSMLSNANFIKIVAYAYQANRMLDEDAALLAARYSTQKALKEYEATGKGITSGPLYDIAVKFLTKDVLKMLHNRKASKRKEATSSIVSASHKQSRALLSTGLAVSITEKRNPPQNYEQVSCNIAQPNVVPVGMFRGAVNQKAPEIVEECILPDDEDCILGTTDEPPPQNAYKKPNSQPLIITSVKSSQRESIPVSSVETIVPEIEHPIMFSTLQPQNNVPTPRVEPFVTITERSNFVLGPNTPTYRLSKSNHKIEPTTADLGRPSTMSNTQPQSRLKLTISNGNIVHPHVIRSNMSQPSNDTICLDSDDDEPAAVNRVTKVVQLTSVKPVGMTRTSAPVPVAVTTSVSSFSGITNVPGVIMRSSNVQPRTPSVVSTEKQTKENQQTKSQKNNLVSVPTSVPDSLNEQATESVRTCNKEASTSLPKLLRLASKPSKSTKGEVSSPIIKKVIRPEDVLNGLRLENHVKKSCKPGDIVRITKDGTLAVLSRVNKLPDHLKTQLVTMSARSAGDTKSQQPGPDKRNSSTPAQQPGPDKRNSSTPAQQPGPDKRNSSAPTSSPRHDPLSILKDVIHIQADEYDEPDGEIQPEKSNKPINHIGATKQKDAGSKITLQYTSKPHPDNRSQSLIKKNFNEPAAQFPKNDLSQFKSKEVTDKKQKSKSGAADLRGCAVNKTVTVAHKADTRGSKSPVIVGSSKDIIIRTKPIGSILTIASTSTTNMNLKTETVKRENTLHGGDTKKRTSPWPDNNSPKKKKAAVFRRTQTLEDFDIDDIDDIIELE